ncbi:helix-turn-helix domain-containing protein [Sutterella sp.]|uniref:helix-turn-helix domain-containing protein n=1 Tax=Sutterella sp. TaxID=1981025 RepID=UPI0026E067D0|nr:helix-turn-helix domain-containing protein [Sutterella sp.]MDO5531497.1 helix-turn-helix domain-containing protein [Sutterella sp.]
MTEWKKATESLREAAVKLFEAGDGYKLTATKLGLSPATVRDWKRAWVKGEFETAYRRRQPLDEMETRIIIELKKFGAPDRTIAGMLNCSISLVQLVWRRYRRSLGSGSPEGGGEEVLGGHEDAAAAEEAAEKPAVKPARRGRKPAKAAAPAVDAAAEKSSD